MTRKDSEKDSERPHYYSQFWLDVAAGRRVIGTPKETTEAEIQEPVIRKAGKIGQDSINQATAAANGDLIDYELEDAESEAEEEEEEEEEFNTPEDEEAEEDEGIPDVDLAEDEEESEDESEDEGPLEEEEEDEEDIGWGGRGRKKPKPGRQPPRPAARKPTGKRDTRRTY